MQELADEDEADQEYVPAGTLANEMLVETLDWVLPPKVTDQVAPVGSPLSVKVTAWVPWKFAVTVPGPLRVEVVVAEELDANVIEPVEVDHEEKTYPAEETAEIVIVEPPLYHEVPVGLTVPPVLGLAANVTWYWTA